MKKRVLRQIAGQFDFEGKFVDAKPMGSGHINDTYLVTMKKGGRNFLYTLQQLNHGIFRNVEGLQDNVCRVTNHIRSKLAAPSTGNSDREVLRVVNTHDGKSYEETPDETFWRAYVYIDKAGTVDVIKNNRQAYEVARTFGAFQKFLADMSGPSLYETIPNFHHTPMRFLAFEEAVCDDPRQRVESCRKEVEFCLGMKMETPVIVDALEAGTLPKRVTHNDAKINNVLFDNATGKGICIIDLDTVMSGSALYDFGDLVRTSVGSFEENEKDLSRVFVDLERFDCLVKGYIEAGRDFLIDPEIRFLHFAGMLITFECGIRFLTDYLQGDGYFRIHYPDENLDRARTQFELVRSIRKNKRAMQKIVDKRR